MLKESMYHAYYHCCFAVMLLHLENKLKLVMKGIELELWIASLTK